MSNRKMKYVSLILTAVMVGMLVAPISMAAGQLPLDLKTAKNFAILAGSTITNTGTTIISGSDGNVGLDPGTSFTGQTYMTISGDINVADAVVSQAKEDLTTAFNEGMLRTPVTTIPTELGGSTITPGTYDTESETFEITGTLTLDALGDENAVFIFKANTTLMAQSYSNMILINNANYDRVFWIIGTSATLGTYSYFEGTILALESITMTTNASIKGQLLASNGAVTLDSNVIINGDVLATETPTGTASATITPQNTSTTTPTTAPTTTTTPTIAPTTTPTITTTPTPTPTTTPATTDINTIESTPGATDEGTTTIIEGQLPNTSVPFYKYLYLGIVLTLAGIAFGLISKKRYSKSNH